MKLKKDPVGIYSDIPIDPNSDLDKCTEDELRDLQDKLIDSDVAVDRNPELEETLETFNPDREYRKIAIEDRLKSLGSN